VVITVLLGEVVTPPDGDEDGDDVGEVLEAGTDE